MYYARHECTLCPADENRTHSLNINPNLSQHMQCVLRPSCFLLLSLYQLISSLHIAANLFCRWELNSQPLLLTLTLPGPSAGLSGSLDSYCSLKPLCSGMGEVVPARTSPTLYPPSPRTVLSLSCFKVLQCINCRD